MLTVGDYRERARRRLPRAIFAHLEAGAGHSEAVLRNLAAFERLLFSPRALVDVTRIDCSTQLFGARLAFPAVVGPSGLNELFRPGADEALARSAAQAGIPFAHATASATSIERIREISDGTLWLQLYVQDDRRLAEDMITRAKIADYQALVVTVDTPRPGKRVVALQAGFRWPLRWSGGLVADLLGHPRWSLATLRRGIPGPRNLAVTAERLGLGDPAYLPLSTPGLQWSDIGWLRDHWPGRLILKGLLAPQDITRAAGLGVDAVVLSNHGGRQLASAPAALDVLRQLTRHGRPPIELLIDGGIRSGEDIAKAVAAGASAVLLGRAPLYGLVAGGAPGIDAVLSILRDELELCLSLLGCPELAGLSDRFLYTPDACTPDAEPQSGTPDHRKSKPI